MTLNRLLPFAALAVAWCLACAPAQAKVAACAEKTALWGKNLEASGSKLSDALPSPDFAVASEGYGYETAMGRACWPSPDPIGEEGGFNLYAMVENDPINFIDWLGQKVVVKFNETQKPTPGTCGNFAWNGKWDVTETDVQKNGIPSGILYQVIHEKTTFYDCTTKKEIFKTDVEKHEAWNVPTNGGDTWLHLPYKWMRENNVPKCSGKIEISAEAWFSTNTGAMPFVPNLGLPPALQNQGMFTADFAGPQYDRTRDKTKAPKAPSRDSNKVKRSLTVTWDCCNGPAPAVIK